MPEDPGHLDGLDEILAPLQTRLGRLHDDSIAH
jgi:hypothetical protein